MKTKTISCHYDTVYELDHNNRVFTPQIVDASRTKRNYNCIVAGGEAYLDFTDPRHVAVGGGEEAGAGGDENLIGQGHAGAFVAVPEELTSGAPDEGFQGLCGGGGVSRQDRIQLRSGLIFRRHGRQIVRAGNAHGACAKLASFQGFVPGDIFV